jgi:hypothetical protein
MQQLLGVLMMQLAADKRDVDERSLLSKALINAGKILGLSQTDLGQVIGRDRTSIHRGIDPQSKSGELALLLIRVYRSLYALVDGDEANIKHWMKTESRHLGGIPADLIKTVEGLTAVVQYLDAMRGKV